MNGRVGTALIIAALAAALLVLWLIWQGRT